MEARPSLPFGRPWLVRALGLLLVFCPSLAWAGDLGDADWLDGLQPGDSLIVDAAGARLRVRPDRLADVRGELEEGRWLRIESFGSLLEVDGLRAPWVEVRDPWAASRGAGGAAARPAWVWGGLLGPLPEGVPEPESGDWERVGVRVGPRREGGGDLLAWGLRRRPGEGSFELGQWSAASKEPARITELSGWARLEAVHWREPGAGRTWLWVVGSNPEGGRKGALVPTLCGAKPLEVLLRGEREERSLRGDLLLWDRDADGVQEAVVQSEERQGHRTLLRRLAWFRLPASGDWSLYGPIAAEEGLLPPPDLRVDALEGRRRGRTVRVSLGIVNEGAAVETTTLVVGLSVFSSRRWGGRARGPESSLRLELPALLPGQRIERSLALDLPPGRWARALLEVWVLPLQPERDLNNNRLAKSLDL